MNSRLAMMIFYIAHILAKTINNQDIKNGSIIRTIFKKTT